MILCPVCQYNGIFGTDSERLTDKINTKVVSKLRKLKSFMSKNLF